MAKVGGVLDITEPLDNSQGNALVEKLKNVLQYRENRRIKDGKGGKNYVEEEAKE